MHEKECKWCKELIITEHWQGYSGHASFCEANPNTIKRKENRSIALKGKLKVERFEIIKKCKKCDTEFKQNLTQSEINNVKINKTFCCQKCANSHIVITKTKIKISKSIKNSVVFKNAMTNRIKKPKIIHKFTCSVCNIDGVSKRKDQKYHNDCWHTISGGIRKGSGRCKGGWYKNYWCDSSWELAYVIYNLDHNIKFERNKEGFEYTYENEIHKYYPDFIVNNQYVEIKGFKTKQTDEKLKSINNLKVLYKEDLKEIFKYVINNYGKDYIKLYDGNPHNKLTNICKYCGNACKSKNMYCDKICAMKDNREKGNRYHKRADTISIIVVNT